MRLMKAMKLVLTIIDDTVATIDVCIWCLPVCSYVLLYPLPRLNVLLSSL